MIIYNLRCAIVNVAREPLHGEVEIADTWVGGPTGGFTGKSQTPGRKAALVIPGGRKTGTRVWAHSHGACSGFQKDNAEKLYQGTDSAGFNHILPSTTTKKRPAREPPNPQPLAHRAIGNLQRLIGPHPRRELRSLLNDGVSRLDAFSGTFRLNSKRARTTG